LRRAFARRKRDRCDQRTLASIKQGKKYMKTTTLLTILTVGVSSAAYAQRSLDTHEVMKAGKAPLAFFENAKNCKSLFVENPEITLLLRIGGQLNRIEVTSTPIERNELNVIYDVTSFFDFPDGSHQEISFSCPLIKRR
jgi:hypothetical protein